MVRRGGAGRALLDGVNTDVGTRRGGIAGGAVDACDEDRRGGIGGGTTLDVTMEEGSSEVVRRGSAGPMDAKRRGSGETGCGPG